MIIPQQEVTLRVLSVKILAFMIQGTSDTFDKLLKEEEDKDRDREKEQEDECRVEVTKDNIEKQRLMKIEAKKGIELFHKNPTKGIAQLIESGVLSDK